MAISCRNLVKTVLTEPRFLIGKLRILVRSVVSAEVVGRMGIDGRYGQGSGAVWERRAEARFSTSTFLPQLPASIKREKPGSRFRRLKAVKTQARFFRCAEFIQQL